MFQLDVDGDGRVSLADFSACAAGLGLAPPPETPAAAAASAAAASASASVNDQRAANLVSKASHLFDQLDVDGSGAIDEEELELVLAGMGLADPGMRKQQAALLMSKLDENGDGDVTRDEFLAAAADPAFAALFDSTAAADDASGSDEHAALAAERDVLCAKIGALFDRLDVDKSGALCVSEIETLLLNLGVLELSERKQRARMIRTCCPAKGLKFTNR
jgi:Ca2+-binding EF-hand superfamily protein